MTAPLLPILNSAAVSERTSAKTRSVLEERAYPAQAPKRYLAPELYTLLQQIVSALLPQDVIGTDVDIAAAIDLRLAQGTNAGWRFVDLPSDGEAYTRGLTVFGNMLQQTPTKSFDKMPPPAQESYLRCVANGDVDGPAAFPLSRWIGVLKNDAVKSWLSHPSAMQKIEYYGFADGSTGDTDGPTSNEGWQAITPNTTLPFEQGIVTPAQDLGEPTA